MECRFLSDESELRYVRIRADLGGCTWGILTLTSSTDVHLPLNTTSHQLERTVHTRPNTHIPTLNKASLLIDSNTNTPEDFEDWEERVSSIFEWVGMAALGSQRYGHMHADQKSRTLRLQITHTYNLTIQIIGGGPMRPVHRSVHASRAIIHRGAHRNALDGRTCPVDVCAGGPRYHHVSLTVLVHLQPILLSFLRRAV